MRRFYIGACSWTGRELLKCGYYPANADDSATRLEYYASRFDAVEVPSTFYAMPSLEETFSWVLRSPPDFLFGVRAPAIFTFHYARLSLLPAWLRREMTTGNDYVTRSDLKTEQRVGLYRDFLRRIEPLSKGGKLGYLLFQFPSSWRFSKENAVYLRRLREMSGSLPLAVEIHHPTWYAGANRERFLDVLMDENISCVVVDEPKSGTFVPPFWHHTAQWGDVIRFHGRGGGDAGERAGPASRRHDYLYSKGELEKWCQRVVEEAPSEGKIFLMFRNCVMDKALRNAAQFKELLERALEGAQKQHVLDFDEDVGI